MAEEVTGAASNQLEGEAEPPHPPIPAADNSGSPETGTGADKRRPVGHHFGLAAWFGLLCLIFPLFMRPYLLLGDGGTARHIATGFYILQNCLAGQLKIPTTNYVWAINPDAPWTTHELIGDILLAAAYQLGGLNGVVLISSLAIAAAMFIAVAAASRRGAGLIFGSLLGLLSVAACSLHWSARAHLFSYAMLAWLYYLIYESQISARGKTITCFVLFAIWSNIHGSTILGMMLIACVFLEALINRCRAKGAAGSTLPHVTVSGSALWALAAVLGSFFTVRGLGLVSYVVNYFFHPSIRNQSDEWRSMDFSLGFPVWAFLGLFAILIAVWTYSPRKPRLSEFLFLLTLGFGGLYAMRLIPYFAILAVPAAAYCWPALRAQLVDSQLLPQVKRLLNTDENFDRDLRFGRFLQITAGVVAAFAALVFLVGPERKLNSFDPQRLPVAAVSYLQSKDIHGLGFTRDNWGGYLNFQTTDKLFIDDKTDFYPRDFIDDYASLYLTYPKWKKVIDKYKFAYILIPSDIPLAYLLSADPGWTKAHADATSTLFLPADDDTQGANRRTQP
jgi:hypothetical protein